MSPRAPRLRSRLPAERTRVSRKFHEDFLHDIPGPVRVTTQLAQRARVHEINSPVHEVGERGFVARLGERTQ